MSNSSNRRRVDLGENDSGYSIYAVGDIHGCIDLLRHAEDLIRKDVERSEIAGLIVLLGDYCDRGADSYGVIEHLLTAPGGGLKRLTLCGNHDDLFLRFLECPRRNWHWLELGGRETLASYGISPVHLDARRDIGHSGFENNLLAELRERVPVRHVEFLRNMPVCARIGRYFFAHAGIRPGVSVENQTDEDLMWIREPFISRGPDLPIQVIHGHTCFKSPSFGPNRIGIDTGAYLTGKLSILKLFGAKSNFLS